MNTNVRNVLAFIIAAAVTFICLFCAHETGYALFHDYTPVSVREMGDKANSAFGYKGRHLSITGKLNRIQQKHRYNKEQYELTLTYDGHWPVTVSCYVETGAQKRKIPRMLIGDTVTVKGRCISFDEQIRTGRKYEVSVDLIEGYKKENGRLFETDEKGTVKVPAKDLNKMINSNILAVENELIKKEIELSGIVGMVDANGSYVVICKSVEDAYDPLNNQDSTGRRGVACMAARPDSAECGKFLSEISKGDSVTIRGRCTKVDESGLELDISGLWIYGPPAITVFTETEDGKIAADADEIEEEFRKNPFRLKQKLQDREIRLSGRIAHIDMEKYLSVGISHISNSDYHFTVGSGEIIMCRYAGGSGNGSKEAITEGTAVLDCICTDVDRTGCYMNIVSAD